MGNPEVTHFTCRAKPPGYQRLGFFRRPDWRRICRYFLVASSFPLSTRKTSGEFDLGAARQCGIRIETAREPTTQSLLLSVPAMVR
jgi:hypothetical protein